MKRSGACGSSLFRRGVNGIGDSRDLCIIGVDILPGYSPGGASARYAVVVLKDGDILQEIREASLGRIIRIVWECGKAVIAVDNVFELVPDKKGLAKLLELLPDSAELVQVTADATGFKSLEEIARSIDPTYSGKLDPLKSAYIIALAASRGIGLKIGKSFPKTKIIITRGRSISRGGMSLNRFLRSVRAGILHVTKEIRKVLDEHNIDYDLYVRKSEGGLERSLFIVYAPREELYGLIKPIKTKGVRVVIKPVPEPTLFSEQATRSNRPVIVGIDPGMTTGVAVIDIDGRVLYAFSQKDADRSTIISIVTQYGSPIAISTDVSNIPDLVEKIASQLGVPVIAPPRDLDSDEKQKILERVVERNKDLILKDSHVKDAVASAWKALNTIQDKIAEVKKYAKYVGVKENMPYIIREVLKGRPVAEVVESFIDKRIREIGIGEGSRKHVEMKPGEHAETGRELKQRIIELEAKIRLLEQEITRRDELIKNLELELKTSKFASRVEEYERRIYLLETEIESLRKSVEDRDKKIEELQSEIARLLGVIRDLYAGKLVVIPRLRKFEELVSAGSDIRYVFVDEVNPSDSRIVEFMRSKKIIVVAGKVVGKAGKMPIIEYTPILRFDDFVVVEKSILDKGMELRTEWEKELEEDEYSRIVKLIEEYQAERMKKLGVKEFNRLI
ncbi:DUF460 domain-containing protein [Thermogladius sp. 4427co]|uniref:DUF460 domain-containing protein n=1 Tax=Thermogladius sp. 4427co TaxID=3450718 RepID=UPI003F796D8A